MKQPNRKKIVILGQSSWFRQYLVPYLRQYTDFIPVIDATEHVSFIESVNILPLQHHPAIAFIDAGSIKKISKHDPHKALLTAIKKCAKMLVIFHNIRDAALFTYRNKQWYAHDFQEQQPFSIIDQLHFLTTHEYSYWQYYFELRGRLTNKIYIAIWKSLTKFERDLCRALVAGQSAHQIQTCFHLNEDHYKAAIQKMLTESHANSKPELAALLDQHDLVQTSEQARSTIPADSSTSLAEGWSSASFNWFRDLTHHHTAYRWPAQVKEFYLTHQHRPDCPDMRPYAPSKSEFIQTSLRYFEIKHTLGIQHVDDEPEIAALYAGLDQSDPAKGHFITEKELEDLESFMHFLLQHKKNTRNESFA